jgi:hypothetical protein
MSFFEEDKETLKTEKETIKIDDNSSIDEVEVIEKDSAHIRGEKEVSNSLIPLESSDIRMNTLLKIKEIDLLYKKGMNQYTQSIHRYNIEIEKLKIEVELENKKNEKEEKILFTIESILNHECKLFETLQHKFTQKAEAFIELRDEYKESLDEHIYREKYIRKENELFVVIDEIEEKELSLLNQELEKINLSNILVKKLRRVEELERSLKELELEKGYFESTGLNQISNLQLEEKPSNTIVDTIIMDDT